MIKLLLLNLVLFFSLQVSDGSDLLEQLQDKYNTVNDFTSSFKQVSESGQSSRGKFYYKTGDKFRIELNSRVMLSDGESVWNYSKKRNKVIITPIDDNTTSFSINDYVFKYPKQCTVKQLENENGKRILWLKPNTHDLNFKEAKLVIGADNLIDELKLTDLMDNNYHVYLSDTKVNQNLSDKLFTFEKMEGTQVIDLR